MLIRKKALKIQERLGMRIGVAYGSSNIGIVEKTEDVFTALEDFYRAGLKAFLLPQQLFKDINDLSELYKEHYTNLIRIKMLASKYNIELAIHNNSLPEEPFLGDALKIYSTIANVMDCRLFVLHPTFYKMMPKDQALKLVVYKLNEIVSEGDVRVKFGIETTGRVNEVGSLEEVLDIVDRTRMTEPVINWAHVHARGSGALRTEKDFMQVVDIVKGGIGTGWLNNAYFIFSGIIYGPSGEIEHRRIIDTDLKLEYLIRTIMAYNIKGTLIFETLNREKDIVEILDLLADLVR
ncbi:MAG TPA: hypothetical protein ENG42_03560 [Candidatus Aenigmarchaeota archaeon]|nr:MAG: hypothetical protein DRP03_01530 [Candidatus Aenigmarchaeota archaeon]HDD46529.1 hypothetical protein [Candidatus Aenigmarchaeota archaeon]